MKKQPMAKLSPNQQGIYDAIFRYGKAPIDGDHIFIDRYETSPRVRFEYLAEQETEFSVSLVVDVNTYQLAVDAWHEEFACEGDVLSVSTKVIEQLETLFDGRIRLQVWYAGKSPYKWELMHDYQQDQWESLSITSLLFYNYFGRKRIEVKTNPLLIKR